MVTNFSLNSIEPRDHKFGRNRDARFTCVTVIKLIQILLGLPVVNTLILVVYEVLF